MWRTKERMNGQGNSRSKIQLCVCATPITVPLNCHLNFRWQGQARQDTSYQRQNDLAVWSSFLGPGQLYFSSHTNHISSIAKAELVTIIIQVLMTREKKLGNQIFCEGQQKSRWLCKAHFIKRPNCPSNVVNYAKSSPTIIYHFIKL